MATLTLSDIPPGYTASVQLYVKSTATTTGSVIALDYASGVYTCTVASGDYDVQLLGVSDPDGARFPMRDGVAWIGFTWAQIDMITLIDAVVVNNVLQPTTAKERLEEPIIIGDDYLASVGRNFEWQVNAISGYVAADLTCSFGGSKDGTGWLVTGTVATITGGISLKFDLPKATTQALVAGYYAWSVEVKTIVGGIEVTRVIGSKPVQLREKQT